MGTERAGCVAIRVEYTDRTVVQLIDFDPAARTESEGVLFEHLRHCQRLPPKRSPR